MQAHHTPPSVPECSVSVGGASGVGRPSPFGPGSTANSNGGLFHGLGAAEASGKLSARGRQLQYKHALDDQLRHKASHDSTAGVQRARSTPRSLPSARTELTADEFSPYTSQAQHFASAAGGANTMLSFGAAEEERMEKRRREKTAYALALQQQIHAKNTIRTEFDPFDGAARSP